MIKPSPEKTRVENPVAGKDPTAEAGNADAAALTIPGSVYTGTIDGISASNTYYVTLDTGTALEDVHCGVGIATGLLGFKTAVILPSGTRVSVLYGVGASYVVGTLPSDSNDSVNGGNRRILHGDMDAITPLSGEEGNVNIPKDMVEGEFEIANSFGVALTMLTTLAQLKAGERAKVECCLYNDMVRIVASKFALFSAVGDETIQGDGRMYGEKYATSYPHELLGNLNAGDELMSMEEDEGALDAEDRLGRIGRWRYTEYLGFLGDFIHEFVTDPTKTIGSMAAELNSAGKSWVNRQSDGSIVIQSVADIAIERVVRIPVPVRVKSAQDSEVQESKEYKELEASYLKMWPLKEGKEKEVYRTAYQLREYARWLSRYQAFARIHQVGKQTAEFKVPSEGASEDPSWFCGEEDRASANAGQMEMMDVYACIRIMRDGSIVSHDGYGSTVSMSNGNVQISASRHIDMEAAGDVRLVAGGNLILKARRHIEITSTVGGIFMKSKCFLKAFCSKGVLWLRSDAKDPHSDTTADTPEDGDPAYEVQEQAVYIEAPYGQTGIRSDKRISIVAEGAPYGGNSGDLTNTTASVVLESRAQQVRSKGMDIILSARRHLSLKAQGATTIDSSFLYADVLSMIIPDSFSVQGSVVRTPGIILSRGVIARDILVGPELGDASKGNHVGISDPNMDLSIPGSAYAQEVVDNVSAAVSGNESIWDFREPKLRTIPKAEYYYESGKERDANRVETLTQQFLYNQDEKGVKAMDGWNYDTWSWAAYETIAFGKRIDPENNKLYGAEATQAATRGGHSLHAAAMAIEYAPTDPSWEVRNNIVMKVIKP